MVERDDAEAVADDGGHSEEADARTVWAERGRNGTRLGRKKGREEDNENPILDDVHCKADGQVRIFLIPAYTISSGPDGQLLLREPKHRYAHRVGPTKTRLLALATMCCIVGITWISSHSTRLLAPV